jgi:hypothetical protein
MGFRPFRPFDISSNPIDVMTASSIVERKPTKTFLEMKDPEAENHIVSGIYTLEQNEWRWTGQSATVLLKNPGKPMAVAAEFRLYDKSPGRTVTLTVDGEAVVSKKYETADRYTLISTPAMGKSDTVSVGLTIDKSFRVSGDQRELGLILVSIGFR